MLVKEISSNRANSLLSSLFLYIIAIKYHLAANFFSFSKLIHFKFVYFFQNEKPTRESSKQISITRLAKCIYKWLCYEAICRLHTQSSSNMILLCFWFSCIHNDCSAGRRCNLRAFSNKKKIITGKILSWNVHFNLHASSNQVYQSASIYKHNLASNECIFSPLSFRIFW